MLQYVAILWRYFRYFWHAMVSCFRNNNQSQNDVKRVLVRHKWAGNHKHPTCFYKMKKMFPFYEYLGLWRKNPDIAYSGKCYKIFDDNLL